ncbi:hypothetical protein Fcan01_01552 [Folsomia candida]|uniref:Kazal-like domain-containing protein n=1 Tax=Folsomia candida TaxID=158441 RepID=A0A226EWH6_FOLCA|nr:hypothetical protein Fcan01_01552 [Folsomia candida]
MRPTNFANLSKVWWIGLIYLAVIVHETRSEWSAVRLNSYRNRDIPIPYQDSRNAQRMTCDCVDEENASVCASNGIRYKNRCQFHCARRFDLNLRIMVDRFCRKFYYAGYRYGFFNDNGRVD